MVLNPTWTSNCMYTSRQHFRLISGCSFEAMTTQNDNTVKTILYLEILLWHDLCLFYACLLKLWREMPIYQHTIQDGSNCRSNLMITGSVQPRMQGHKATCTLYVCTVMVLLHRCSNCGLILYSIYKCARECLAV